MKKIINSILSIMAWPLRFVKKIKFDNFVGGLVFGAIFSLIVNVVTVHMQESIDKQRTLEALENEIMMNLLQANNVISKNNDALENKTPINYFYYSPTYSTDFWTQSSEPLRYTAQLDQEIQGEIMSLYSVIYKNANAYVVKANKVFEQDHSKCFGDDLTYKGDDYECMNLITNIRTTENLAANLVSEFSNEVLNCFHPTQDRLENWFLKLIMGNKSTKILSRK